MDDPPPYEGKGRLPNWSLDEKSNLKGKDRAIDNDKDDYNEDYGLGGELYLEESHPNPTAQDDRQLTLPSNKESLASGRPKITIHPSMPTHRISASYFRPQATLDQPLDLDLQQDASTSRDALVLHNSETSLAPFRPPPGLSEDEQLALVLSRNPDIDFDDALKMLENAESEAESAADIPNTMQMASRTTSILSNPRISVSPSTSLTIKRQQDLTARRPSDEYMHSLPQVQQQKSRSGSMVSYGGKASSISPSESASQIPKTIAEQEDEDLQFALELSRKDSGPPLRPSGESSRMQDAGSDYQLRRNLAPISTVSMSSLLQNSATPRAPVLYETLAPAAPAQPLFDLGATSSLLGGSHNALLPRPNLAVEQQRLADVAAIHNLQAERSALRSMAESDLYSQLSTPQEDRALKAQLALARENLRDSKLTTQMTTLSLNQNRIAQMKRYADEEEIAQAQRQVDAESRRRFQLAQAEARKQESMEKARLRDRRWQTTQDDLREQEERDRAFALELQQMQHDQVIEKVDAFGRNASQPARRTCAIHPVHQSLDMRTTSSADGDRREIVYEATPSTGWNEEDERTALQGWNDYEKGRGGSRGGSSDMSSLGRGRGRGKRR